MSLVDDDDMPPLPPMTVGAYQQIDRTAYTVRLFVPYANRAAVSEAGARWFSDCKAWFVAYDTPAFYACRDFWEDTDKWEAALRTDAAFATRRLHPRTHYDTSLKCTWVCLKPLPPK